MVQRSYNMLSETVFHALYACVSIDMIRCELDLCTQFQRQSVTLKIYSQGKKGKILEIFLLICSSVNLSKQTFAFFRTLKQFFSFFIGHMPI